MAAAPSAAAASSAVTLVTTATAPIAAAAVSSAAALATGAGSAAAAPSDAPAVSSAFCGATAGTGTAAAGCRSRGKTWFGARTLEDSWLFAKLVRHVYEGVLDDEVMPIRASRLLRGGAAILDGARASEHRNLWSNASR
mmetsp:Transcript_97051/g.256465  ORF Transcript_97051/g.256465 Transcript_97051/m.256465 type:complete len:139 (+) Transcript_97051:137-553(+)